MEQIDLDNAVNDLEIEIAYAIDTFTDNTGRRVASIHIFEDDWAIVNITLEAADADEN